MCKEKFKGFQITITDLDTGEIKIDETVSAFIGAYKFKDGTGSVSACKDKTLQILQVLSTLENVKEQTISSLAENIILGGKNE